jgi:hypothetical protein
VVCGHQTDLCKTFTGKKMTKSQSKNAELPIQPFPLKRELLKSTKIDRWIIPRPV